MAYPISDVTRRVVYSGSAGTGPYSFSFEVLANTDIAVYKNTTLLTLTTDYTVTINSNGTGSVTLVSAATGSDNITLVGDRAIERATDFVTGGDLFANSLNDEFDSLVIFSQQIKEEAGRGLKAPITDPTDVNMTLPVKATRKGTVLAFNATTGNPEAGPSISSVTTVAAQSANINTVAANIADVNDCATNMAAIIDAPNQASAAASSASSASSSASSATASAAAAAASAASGMYSAVQDKSANYTIVAGDAGDLIRVTTTAGARTITLPAIAGTGIGDGFKITVVKWTGDGNAVTISRSSSDTINGATSYTLGNQYSSATFVADAETNQWFAAASGLGTTNANVDVFSGNGSTVAFTLSGDPGNKNNTAVAISGVYQAKATYSVSGTTLTFTQAPPSGSSNIEVVWNSPLAIGVPSDATVTPAKLSTGGLTWDTSGNVGLGVTPSAWGSIFKAIQGSGGGALAFRTDAANTELLANAYFNGTNFIYQKTGYAALRYRMEDGGTIAWFNAPSGTAGNAITFTQAMTLDANGNLGVGTTSPSVRLDVSGGSLRVNEDGAGTKVITLRSNYASVGPAINVTTNDPLLFLTNNTERARIDSSGNLMVGTTSATGKRVSAAVGNSVSTSGYYAESGTSYTGTHFYGFSATASGTGWYHFVGQASGPVNTIFIYGNGNIVNANNSYGLLSDIKLKENIVDATPKLEKLMQVRIVNYNLKGDLGYETHKQLGVVAQELEQVFPGLVDEAVDKDAEGNDLETTTKSVKMSVFVPMLIKAMQEQQALIETLTARITALEGNA